MMSTAIEIFYRDDAEVRKTLLKLIQFLGGKHIIFPALRTPRHDQEILAFSPNLRPLLFSLFSAALCSQPPSSSDWRS